MDPKLRQRINDLTVMLVLSIEQNNAIMVGNTRIGVKEQKYLLQIIEVFNKNWPKKRSEKELMHIIGEMGCHARYEGNVIPIEKQRKTSERTVRRMINLLRKLGFPVISYTSKAGEAEDRISEDQRWGYRWGIDKEDQIEQLRRKWSEIIQYCITATETFDDIVRGTGAAFPDFEQVFPFVGIQREAQRAKDAGNPYE